MRFWGLFCRLGVRSVCNGSPGAHSAFCNLRPAPPFQSPHVFFGCCWRFYLNSLRLLGFHHFSAQVNCFISPSHLSDRRVGVRDYAGTCSSISRRGECFFIFFLSSLSWGKFSTFSSNRSLIAGDCHCCEGLVFTCQLGVHCVPGS